MRPIAFPRPHPPFPARDSYLALALASARARARSLTPGRIGVLGGSGDYSGAPFFSAFGAMRFGADLAHVICEPEAGNVIKT